MAYTVDFKTVSTIGLESSPVAAALAGLRANEARYIWNKYKEPYITYPAAEKPDSLAWVNEILAERDLHPFCQALGSQRFELTGFALG